MAFELAAVRNVVPDGKSTFSPTTRCNSCTAPTRSRPDICRHIDAALHVFAVDLVRPFCFLDARELPERNHHAAAGVNGDLPDRVDVVPRLVRRRPNAPRTTPPNSLRPTRQITVCLAVCGLSAMDVFVIGSFCLLRRADRVLQLVLPLRDDAVARQHAFDNLDLIARL